ncbi:hypothetical protein V22_19780 [Calycomorphotria hydatis]|uniref:Uncharacterized protein n=1 Tax=Calycomorphotria hydatis TaxID=2528027 RepID=A0A517T8P2_9PLAN|nr:hypothetical protein V22_19780 [Calycomorphotria hydatis]
MPTDLECSECRLGFSVGLYHYHTHPDGYFGRRLLVCRDCGCQHFVEVPFSDTPAKPALESFSDLIIDCPKLCGTKLLFSQQQQQWGRRQELPDQKLSNIRCQRCNSLGNLSDTWHEEWACPNCSHTDTISKLTHWMT